MQHSAIDATMLNNDQYMDFKTNISHKLNIKQHGQNNSTIQQSQSQLEVNIAQEQNSEKHAEPFQDIV